METSQMAHFSGFGLSPKAKDALELWVFFLVIPHLHLTYHWPRRQGTQKDGLLSQDHPALFKLWASPSSWGSEFLGWYPHPSFPRILGKGDKGKPIFQQIYWAPRTHIPWYPALPYLESPLPQTPFSAFDIPRTWCQPEKCEEEATPVWSSQCLSQLDQKC